MLQQIVNPKHELVQLSSIIDWNKLTVELSERYNNDQGRPAKPIRLMSSLLILKYLYDLSDEELIDQWIQNPYYQYFSGYSEFSWEQPCASSELVHFRYRIGQQGEELIFRESIQIHDHLPKQKGKSRKTKKQKQVISDTTVQEKNITYPTDTKLYRKVIIKCRRIAEQEGIKLRQSYRRTIPKLMLAQRFRDHPKNRSKALRAERKLKTIAGRLVREINRKVEQTNMFLYEEFLDIANRVLLQSKYDKNKIYSIHEPHVYCVSKGKEAKKYEYGCKANLVWGMNNGLILAATHLKEHVHDSKSIAPSLDQFKRVNGYLPAEYVTDRGFRGKSEVMGVKVSIPKPVSGKVSDYQRDKTRKKFRKRAGIEPVIGHVKGDFRMKRNYLGGIDGDRHNILMAAAAFNFRKWIREYKNALKKLFEIFLDTIVSVGGTISLEFSPKKLKPTF